MVPLKTERQSGLLFPNISFFEGFLGYSQSYFWAIDRSSDATFDMIYNPIRGPKFVTEYRYLLDKSSGGRIKMGFMEDNHFSDELQKNQSIEAPKQRWFFNYSHRYYLPDNYTHLTKFNLVSDTLYLNDYPRDFNRHPHEPALENFVSLNQSNETTYKSIEASYYVNLLHNNPLNNNQDAVHRFPEIRYSAVNQRLSDSNFFFNFDLNYINFARSNFTYDDNFCEDEDSLTCTENYCEGGDCQDKRDGTFDEEVDFYRTGQRVDIKPSFSYPFRWGKALDLVPEISYRETRYAFGVGTDPNVVRRFFRGSITARSTFSRVFGEQDERESYSLKHEVQPELTLTRIPDGQIFSDDEHPFFERESPDILSDRLPPTNSNIIGENGENNLQFDFNDRIFDRHLYTLGIRNKWITKEWVGDVPRYKQVASVLIQQSYDVRTAEANNPDSQPYSALEIDTEIRLDKFSSNIYIDYFHNAKVSDVIGKMKYALNRMFDLGLEYNLDYNPDSDKFVKNRTEEIKPVVILKSKYVDLKGEVVLDATNDKDDAFQEIRSIYRIKIKPPGDCWSFLLTYDIDKNRKGNEYDPRFSFSFKFDGKTETTLNSDDFSY